MALVWSRQLEVMHGNIEDAEALRDLPYVLDKVNARGDMLENVSRPEISRTSRPAA